MVPSERELQTRKFMLPGIELLVEPSSHLSANETMLIERARQIVQKCAEFDVIGCITNIHPGPVVTTFEFKPDPGVKYSRIIGLAEDLCLGINAESIRIDRIPGRGTVGIEVSNSQPETILLRELLESDVFRNSSSRLSLALGKLNNGNVYVEALNKMPHLLIAGADKTVGLDAMITSILYKATPEEVQFLLIDLRRLDLGIYSDLPHLLTPIVNTSTGAMNVLRWATNEIELRYRRFALRGVRNIEQYNSLICSTLPDLSQVDMTHEKGELERPLPYVVLVISELADLMIVSGREVEESLSRMATIAGAAGVHIIIASERPSTDVFTEVIKASFGCRIAYKVATISESRAIVEADGAELLLGNGDMLLLHPGLSRLVRIQSGYVSVQEVQAVVEHLRQQRRGAYGELIHTCSEEEIDGEAIDSSSSDRFYEEAVRLVITEGRASASLLQRRLGIGYGQAAKLIDMMHQNQLVGPANGSNPREVLVGLDFLDRLN